MLDEADIVYPGHDQPFRLVDGEVRYEEPMRLTITGVSPDEPGLAFAPPSGRSYSMDNAPALRSRRWSRWE